MSDRVEGAAWAVVAVLACGALYEALVAIEVVPMGEVPGEGPFASTFVLLASLLALLVGCVVAFAGGPFGARRSLAWAALAPAGVAYLLARWFSFDPYYLPTLRRFSEGAIAGEWVLVVVIAALVAGLPAGVLVRIGYLVTGLVLVLEALTVWILPFGK